MAVPLNPTSSGLAVASMAAAISVSRSAESSALLRLRLRRGMSVSAPRMSPSADRDARWSASATDRCSGISSGAGRQQRRNSPRSRLSVRSHPQTGLPAHRRSRRARRRDDAPWRCR